MAMWKVGKGGKAVENRVKKGADMGWGVGGNGVMRGGKQSKPT